jgi:uncharacterized protein YbjT (DUF2867 family)
MLRGIADVNASILRQPAAPAGKTYTLTGREAFRAAAISPDVEMLLARAPRAFEQFVTDHLASWGGKAARQR